MSAERPSGHRLKQAKRRLRRAILDDRDALAPYDRRERSRRIVDRILAMPELRRAGTVMAFWSFGSEVDTAPLLTRLHEAGIRIALPRIQRDDVIAVDYVPGDVVAPTPFGAMEPTEGRPVDVEEIDVVVVPGVAFDRDGARVGYGGGFYDRFLRRVRPGVPAVAIAFAMQVVGRVPTGSIDRLVDAVVTEDEVIRCRTG
jgi:5-formyltetrahydrofolate cyclo-ligase